MLARSAALGVMSTALLASGCADRFFDRDPRTAAARVACTTGKKTYAPPPGEETVPLVLHLDAQFRAARIEGYCLLVDGEQVVSTGDAPPVASALESRTVRVARGKHHSVVGVLVAFGVGPAAGYRVQLTSPHDVAPLAAVAPDDGLDLTLLVGDDEGKSPYYMRVWMLWVRGAARVAGTGGPGSVDSIPPSLP
jgi:hypothetical protein